MAGPTTADTPAPSAHMMALMPVSCCRPAIDAVTISMGQYLRESMAAQLCFMLTLFATSAADTMSAYSICLQEEGNGWGGRGGG